MSSNPIPTRAPERSPEPPKSSSVEGLPALERPARFIIKVVGHVPA